LIFSGQPISAGILSPPELANGFRCVIKPLTICQEKIKMQRLNKLNALDSERRN